jgi:signal transduction histidine kinase
MSSVSLSRPSEHAERVRNGFSIVPRTIFGRLFVSVLAAVILAQALSFALVARDRAVLVVEGNVREWSRRIVDLTFALQLLDPATRAVARSRLTAWPPDHLPHPTQRSRPPRPPGPPSLTVPEFQDALQRQLAYVLGPGYQVSVSRTLDPGQQAIRVARQPAELNDAGARLYDVNVHLPDGDSLLFRVTAGRRPPPLPRNLVLNLSVIAVLLALVLYLLARSITRPLSQMARAAEALGRDVRQPPLDEPSTLELREAARAFNTMHERMRRYIDSRTRVLAAMSHDLKTPLTRLRLRVESLSEEERDRFGRDLDEMESMVRGTLSMLKGLSDDEAMSSVDVNELLATLRAEFAELGASIEVRGRARSKLRARPQALKRCLTNLISNAIHFGVRARVLVEDGAALVIRIQDDGPGVPAEELGRVFEPFYRVESSRNRDTGGTGLGLSIALDIAQSHGGSLALRNLPQRGLEATLTLPRGVRHS